MIENTNPFNIGMYDISMTKHDGSDPMSIAEQVVEFSLFQSIFSPVLKGNLSINDYVGLINNYPMIGEEIITVFLKQSTDEGENNYKIEFVITAIREILIGNDNRQTVYNVELASKEAYLNSLELVAKAYVSPIDKIIKDVVENNLKSKKKIKFVNDTKKTRKLVIPNMSPFAAVDWLCNYAVSEDDKKYYTYAFYETLGASNANEFRASPIIEPEFVFKAIQRPTWRAYVDDEALVQAKKNPYYYISNIEMMNRDAPLYKSMVSQGFDVNRIAKNFKFNKRLTMFEKIVGGYFENEYVEINLQQKDHKITKFNIRDDQYSELNNHKLNTVKYIDAIIDHNTNSEKSPKTKYVINNYDDQSQPSFRTKWGRDASSFLAYAQVDISLVIYTDLRLRAGDVIWVNIPEFHGFDAAFVDTKLSGYFMISEIKNIVRNDGFTYTTLRLNKDSYLTTVDHKSYFAERGIR